MKSISKPFHKRKLEPGSIFFILAFLFTIVSSVLLYACGSKNSSQDIVAPEGMSSLDLSKYGKPFVIFVPDTTRAKLTVEEQTSGALDIKVGTNFAVSIFEQAADLELKKKDLKGDEVNKLKQFITEDPNALFWESEITGPEFHFLINTKIGNTDYSFQDIIDNEAKPFGKETMQKMFDSCRNTKEIKKS